MAYRVKTYTLREEAAENGTRYFISFKDGQGDCHELEVSEQFFIEFRQMERRNRNLLQSNERHKEFVVIPAEIEGKKVEMIGKGAFYGCSSLTSVEIPSSVTEMGSCVFSYCTSLTSVTISGNLKKIEGLAFYGCKSLTSVEILGSVTEIGDFAFSDCTSLTSAEIPDSVTKIGYSAFYGCKSLTAVIIPESVKQIDPFAFDGCFDDLTIYGYTDSYAEKYAKENEITFVPIDAKCSHKNPDFKTEISDCEKGGKILVICKECGKTIDTKNIAPVDHSFGEWKVTTTATCTEKGVETSTCSVCGKPQTRDIDALGHDYGEWTVEKPATCTEKGTENALAVTQMK